MKLVAFHDQENDRLIALPADRAMVIETGGDDEDNDVIVEICVIGSEERFKIDDSYYEAVCRIDNALSK